jgi:hypothetical protein
VVLNRSKVLKELQVISSEIFCDFSAEYEIAWQSWKRVCADPLFAHKVRQTETNLLMPTWHEPLHDAIVVPHPCPTYQLVAVDGSQIYPDRHAGTSCYLINIGLVTLQYGYGSKGIMLDSIPLVFGYSNLPGQGNAHTSDMINCKREELELQFGLQQCMTLKKDTSDPVVLLLDGSLIFWHLQGVDNQLLKSSFLGNYLGLMHQLYLQNILYAGYISLPKNKELVNLIRWELNNNPENLNKTDHELAHVIDTSVAQFFLHPFTRSIVFKNHAAIVHEYPEHLSPWFFYLDVDTETVRVEIPAWIAQDPERVEWIARVIVDQAIKGRGYPVALAEAHEQAVVKGPDRDFFYHLITKLAIDRKQKLVSSQKSMKKRRMGI